ncbi:Signal peptide peptidase-like 3 [Holothuria leucospilota]|uniref:Signal peptide peptidase-like 3 n=1 Tax=Holothuria leucospilota TaxID=206669 RepID=A0A9Q1HE83_HOLLE|nr:Signal peptide peptidase-like 3 [Holothuria leucospilota]
MNRQDRLEAVAMTEYDWAYSLVDSSRVSTFLISILLIVYGSFRSLNIDQEERERKEREEDRDNLLPTPPSGQNAAGQPGTENGVVIDTSQAMFLPIGASVSLLVMFFFFDSMQMVFAVCTAVLATVAFAFLLLPMCQYLMRPCSTGTKISFGICGRFTSAEIMSFCLSVMLVFMWVMTGHWLLMDALAMGLCVTMIAFVRLPSLKVSTLLLTGLLIYDVFWVFFSTYIFNANVMVRVATRPADNPVGVIARRLDLPNVAKDAPKLSLPGKLIFPSMHSAGHFSMLGLGDIVMPGLLLCFVLRYDNWKRQTAEPALPPAMIPHGSLAQKVTYFHCSLIGYFVGLLTATVSSEVYKNAQPALLYLVPFTLLPLVIMAYLKGDLKRMWHEPFIKTKSNNPYQEV